MWNSARGGPPGKQEQTRPDGTLCAVTIWPLNLLFVLVLTSDEIIRGAYTTRGTSETTHRGFGWVHNAVWKKRKHKYAMD